MIGGERNSDTVSAENGARIAAVRDDDLIRRHDSDDGSGSNGVALLSLDVTPAGRGALERATPMADLLVHPLKAPLHRALPFHSLSYAFHLFLHYLMQQILTLHSNLKRREKKKGGGKRIGLRQSLNQIVHWEKGREAKDVCTYMRATMAVEHAEKMESVWNLILLVTERRVNRDSVFHVSSPSTNRGHAELRALTPRLRGLGTLTRIQCSIRTQHLIFRIWFFPFLFAGHAIFHSGLALARRRWRRTEVELLAFPSVLQSRRLYGHIGDQFQGKDIHSPAPWSSWARLDRSRRFSFSNYSTANPSHSNSPKIPIKRRGTRVLKEPRSQSVQLKYIAIVASMNKTEGRKEKWKTLRQAVEDPLKWFPLELFNTEELKNPISPGGHIYSRAACPSPSRAGIGHIQLVWRRTTEY